LLRLAPRVIKVKTRTDFWGSTFHVCTVPTRRNPDVGKPELDEAWVFFVTKVPRSEAPTNSLDTLRAVFGSAYPPKRYDTRGTAISFSRTAHELVRRHLPVGPSQLWRLPSFPAFVPLVAAFFLVLPLVLARSRSSFGGGLLCSTWCFCTPSPPFSSPSPLSWTQSVFSSVFPPVLAVVAVGLASPFL
jgi:hypothetical protein